MLHMSRTAYSTMFIQLNIDFYRIPQLANTVAMKFIMMQID